MAERVSLKRATAVLEDLLARVERGEIGATRGQVERLEGALIAVRAMADRTRRSPRHDPALSTRDERRVYGAFVVTARDPRGRP